MTGAACLKGAEIAHAVGEPIVAREFVLQLATGE